MSYALLQTDIKKPSPDALRRAFKGLVELVDIDAATLANDGYGIITAGLSYEHAEQLSQALNAQGVPTAVVDESEIVRLPPAKHLRRIDCLPESLVLRDALGRSTSTDWKHVVLVAAGFVTLTETKRIERTRIVFRGTGWRGGACPVVLADVSHKEESKARLLLEIYLDVPPGRVQLQGDECQYDYLGNRLKPHYSDNFVILVQDVTNLASGALANRGADSLRSDQAVTFRYPTKHAFEEEIIWLLWTKLRAGMSNKTGGR